MGVGSYDTAQYSAAAPRKSSADWQEYKEAEYGLLVHIKRLQKRRQELFNEHNKTAETLESKLEEQGKVRMELIEHVKTVAHQNKYSKKPGKEANPLQDQFDAITVEMKTLRGTEQKLEGELNKIDEVISVLDDYQIIVRDILVPTTAKL
ncbi:hypothetical protein B7494_g5883 [Chlorociboria aeruginascens]|nr:hypothetical protein B7494_g5883 [Chlorociboria aeruginascens]